MISRLKLAKISVKHIVLATIVGCVPVVDASTWCSFENFDVVVAGDRYSAVYGTSLDAEGKYVYLGDLNTEKGRAIHSLLLAASLAGKAVQYGNNNQDYACGELPAYSADTANPPYLRMMASE